MSDKSFHHHGDHNWKDKKKRFDQIKFNELSTEQCSIVCFVYLFYNKSMKKEEKKNQLNIKKIVKKF